MSRLARWLLLLGVVVTVGVSWFWRSDTSPVLPPCNDKLGCVNLAPGEPVRLGVIQALTGRVAVLGTEQVRGLELALDRRQGRLFGRQVLLQVEDTGCKAEGGANAALKIVSDPAIVAIFGTTCSGDAASAALVMSEAGLSMISGNNSAPFLTAMGGVKAPKWQAGFLRTAPNEEHSGPAAARYAHQVLGIRRAATLDDGDLYTKGLTSGFQQEFARLGGAVTATLTIDKNDTNMAPMLESVRQSGSELLFFPLFQPEGNLVLQQARRTKGLEKLILMSDGSLIESSFIKSVGADAVGMYFVGPTPPAPSPGLDQLAAEYKAKYKTDPPTIYYQSAFDAANILFAALEKAARTNPDGSIDIGRQALRDALYATRNFDGVCGRLSCDEFGDCGVQSFNVLRLDDPAGGVQGLRSNVMFTYKKGL